jgi:cytochrome c-type biogenesis protein
VTLWLLAFGAGMLATVNPCGFAMLPAFIAYYFGDDDGSEPRAVPVLHRLGQGLSVGVALSLGFAGTFSVAGLLVAFGLRSLVGAVPWAAVVIGALLVVLGLAMLTGRQVYLRIGKNVRPGTGRGYGRMVWFGAAYAIASLSCTLAVLLAVIAQATATANPLRLLGVFAGYGLGAATVLIALSITIALAKATVTRAIRKLLPIATRLGALLLVLSGSYLISYWLPSLMDGRRQGPSTVGRLTEGLSSRLAAVLSAHQELVAALAGALVILAAVAVAVQRRRDRRAAPSGTQPPQVDCCEPEGLTPAVAGDDCCSSQNPPAPVDSGRHFPADRP